MAFAMIKGFIASELCDPADISVIVRSDGPKTEAIRCGATALARQE